MPGVDRNYKDVLFSQDETSCIWEKIYQLSEYHEIEFVWVKGHNGHDYNERCDKLATAYADSFDGGAC